MGRKRLEDMVGVDRAAELMVTTQPPKPVSSGGVAVQATTSRLSLAAPQAIELARQGWNVLSTCEELSHLGSHDASVARGLDSVARRAHVSVLASGINPGFMMDTLPLTLSALCARVDAISVRRIVDTNQRREQRHRKAGAGLTTNEFERLATEGRIGHVGLPQSVNLIADHLGWQLDAVDLERQPIVASDEVVTPFGTIPAGSVTGQRQVAVGRVAQREVIRLELVMAAGSQPLDEIFIDGEPSVHQVIEGGVNGDIGTEALIANLVGRVYEARPGFLTMADLVPVWCAPGR